MEVSSSPASHKQPNLIEKIWIKKDLNEVYGYLAALSNEAKYYFLFLASLLVFSLAYIFQESLDHNIHEANRNRNLGEGWLIMAKKADIADFEWTFWFSEARQTLVSIYIGHVTTSWLLSTYLLKQRDNFLCAFGITCAYLALGLANVILISGICAVYYIISKQSSVRLVAVVSTFFLLSNSYSVYMQSTFGISSYSVLAQSAFTFTVFRCSSFALEQMQNPLKFKGDLLTLFQYNFYMPFFFFGPVMTYNCFVGQMTKSSRQDLISSLVPDICRLAMYVIAIDFSRHYFYISSLPLDDEFMKNAPLVVVGFLGFFNFYLDWMKGKVLYTLSSGIARHIDGYVDAPRCCKCVIRIYTFADTYFDRGIQHWLCRYIYDPLGNGHLNTKNEALAGAVSFLIVTFMQGLGWQVSTWAFFNWLGLTLEFYFVKKFQKETHKRFLALIFGLNYWCIIVFNCIGINGVAAFKMYFDRLFVQGGIPGVALTAFIGYCYVFINMEKNEKKTK